ncbi:MAG: sulfatase [Planctomycetes bacterium]|nr:sulfatase [Planctomycetota bacterium]
MVLSSSLWASSQQKKPNVVFVLVDDLGWMDLGCQGSLVYKTPNIDRLADSAMRFTDAYASCPVCSPTRASIMTGKSPTRLNITDWIPGADPKNRKWLGPQDRHELPLSEVTLAETFKDHGYKTFFAGKWHLGSDGYFPEDQGFDINQGGHHRGSPPGGYYTPYKNPKLANGPEGEYLTDRLTDESIQFMQDNKNSPFFLYLSFYTVHTPIQACKRLIEENKQRVANTQFAGPARAKEQDGQTKLWQDNAAFASMVQAMDENVGRVLAKVDALGLKDNTVIVFTSDNGGLSTLKRPNAPTSNAPLRAGKGWCYEGGIRTPLIICAPGVTQGKSTCNFPVTSMDYYPTLLQLAGIDLKPDQHADGISLVPQLAGVKSAKRRALYWHYPHYHGSMWTPGAAIRFGDWKLVEFLEEGKVELYNLKDDIGETQDLADAKPDVTQRLLSKLHEWQKETGARMPELNPNYGGRNGR